MGDGVLIAYYRVNGQEFMNEIHYSPAWWKPKDIKSDRRALGRVAVACAEDFHSNHDGWECSWPLELEVLSGSGGPAIGRFEIECENVPSFNAHPLDED